MKAFLLLLLIAICSLTKATRTNLRLLRSIPNRKPRDPLPIAKPIDIQELDRAIDRGDIPPPPSITVVIPSVIDGVQVSIIFNYFSDNESNYEELVNKLLNDSQDDALQYCLSLNTDFTEALCNYYISFLNDEYL